MTGESFRPVDSMKRLQAKPKKPNKYRAVKTEVDGITFDSKKEAKRYEKLRDMVEEGAISHLALQPEFPIVINGQKICKYKADFTYISKYGHDVYEDVKGVKTAAYRIKKKLVEALYGIRITEVM